MRKIFLGMLLMFCMHAVGQVDFSGDWYWIEVNDDHSFEITLTKVNDSCYTGVHCGVFYGGRRMDCVADDDVLSLSGVVQGDSLMVTFTSQYCLKQGKAVIKFSGDSIVWKIIEEPDEEYFLPREAILRRG